jgi:hypothetical protein
LDPAPGLRPLGDSALFDRIGGQATVDSLVDSVYARFEADGVIRPFFWRDLSNGLKRQKLFFAEWLGGPPATASRLGARCISTYPPNPTATGKHSCATSPDHTHNDQYRYSATRRHATIKYGAQHPTTPHI